MRDKFIVFFMLVLTIIGCGRQQQQVEKRLEDGVEVIINHIDPYQIEGQSPSLRLEEVMTLDTEDPEVDAAGLVDINAFQVDSEGNIYCLSNRGENHFFFKFNREGKFVKAFGAKGQGPGEMEFPLLPRILPQNQLTVTDVLKKLMIFDAEGKVVSETRIDPVFVIVNPLENGNFVAFWKAGAEDAADKHFKEKVSLFNPEDEEIRQLDVLHIAKKIYFLDPIFSWHVGRNRTYHINEQRGYEILVYDSEGSLIQKILKQYDAVRLTADTKDALLEGMPDKPQLLDTAIIPDYLPPVHAIFSDEEGRLYAVTFEAGERPGEYWCDVYTNEGVFFTRISLPVHFSRDSFPIYALVKNQHLYCVGEKENGYLQLKVFRMLWN
ncbi:MAG: 6-bladed beta-propeller [Candidatus Aminicenantes bacterium]